MPKLTVDPQAITTLAQAVIDIEASAVTELAQRIDHSFIKAVEILIACKGRIIVTGIGKSGHIGNKLAATFASTGSPAFFVHAAEASHGDIGMMQAGDVVIAISYSGSSDEILKLVPGIKRLGLPLITLCGKPSSALSKAADVNLDISVTREACPLGLAPTASTTCTLVMGDALAISLLQTRGFSEEDFARSHPGGRLGRQLLMLVSDVMNSLAETPIVHCETLLADALFEITRKGLGIAVVIDSQGELVGVFTDGDLRRSYEKSLDIRSTTIEQIMTKGGQTISSDELAVNAVSKMQQNKITAMPVLLEKRVVGVVTMHTLLSAGVA